MIKNVLITLCVQVNTTNDQGLTVLMVACLREDVAVVRMLLETGAGIDVRNPGIIIQDLTTIYIK